MGASPRHVSLIRSARFTWTRAINNKHADGQSTSGWITARLRVNRRGSSRILLYLRHIRSKVSVVRSSDEDKLSFRGKARLPSSSFYRKTEIAFRAYINDEDDSSQFRWKSCSRHTYVNYRPIPNKSPVRIPFEFDEVSVVDHCWINIDSWKRQ